MSPKRTRTPEQKASRRIHDRALRAARSPDQIEADSERARLAWATVNREQVNAAHRAAHALRYAADPQRYIDQQARWAVINRDKINARERRHRHANLEAFNEKRRLKRVENREKANAATRRWIAANREKFYAARKLREARRIGDVSHRLAGNLRKRLGRAVRIGSKSGSAVRDLGCSIDALKQHLESLFQPGMTWKKWSMHGWHIDHVKPLAAFDLTDRVQFLAAAHYTNLQPLWAVENIVKSAKVAS